MKALLIIACVFFGLAFLGAILPGKPKHDPVATHPAVVHIVKQATGQRHVQVQPASSANPVHNAQQDLVKLLQVGAITEAQYVQGIALIQREGEAAVCAARPRLFAKECR